MDAEQKVQIERREGDEMIRATLMDGQVRVMMCETTRMTQRAADIHHATPVCTAAMGRLMTATSMLGVMMKCEDESVTVNIKGGGPMGTIVAVAKLFAKFGNRSARCQKSENFLLLFQQV